MLLCYPSLLALARSDPRAFFHHPIDKRFNSGNIMILIDKRDKDPTETILRNEGLDRDAEWEMISGEFAISLPSFNDERRVVEALEDSGIIANHI